MAALVTLLALAGVAAILLRTGLLGLRVALHTAEVTAASGLAEISQRRGDLTGMAERQEAVRVARRARSRDAFRLALWLAWLVIPAFTDSTREVYAIAAPLWLLPAPRVRRQQSVEVADGAGEAPGNGERATGRQ